MRDYGKSAVLGQSRGAVIAGIAWCCVDSAKEEDLLVVTRDARRQTQCQANRDKVGELCRKDV